MAGRQQLLLSAGICDSSCYFPGDVAARRLSVKAKISSSTRALPLAAVVAAATVAALGAATVAAVDNGG